MSTLIIRSSCSSAAASCGPFGADSTGFDATEMIALTCPWPGVVISSARQPADRFRIDPPPPRNALRRELGDRGVERREPIDVLCHPTEPHPLFAKQDVHHAEQQEHIAAGADEEMLIRDLGRLGPPRID